MTIQQIIEAFTAGERVVSFKTKRPHQDRKRLYAAARVRGYLWRFATLKDEVFVAR